MNYGTFKSISVFKPELYDLLLIDIKMSDINDFELYQELQQKIKAEKNKILYIRWKTSLSVTILIKKVVREIINWKDVLYKDMV